ncbi:hypothetical protein GCM10020254_04900 [Streptomyces goshikiensis]
MNRARCVKNVRRYRRVPDGAVEERVGSGETQFGADGLAAAVAANVDAVGEALDEWPSVPARPVGGACAG